MPSEANAKVLYKITPALVPAEVQKAETPQVDKEPRKRRKSAVYDADGNEVLITMMCLKCRQMKPLTMFGLRKMADGAIRNQPWCRGCRSSAAKKKPAAQVPEEAVAATPAPADVDGPIEQAAPSVIDQLLAGPVV